MTWSLVSDVEAGRRAMLLFGDTGADTGNNNYLATKYRADSPPYGIDFPAGRRPTGRFSNGLIPPDFISYQIGLGYILPYLSPDLKGELLLRGASFASAGIGILNATGVQRKYNKDECDDELQNAVASFNARLFQMTTQMNSEFGYDVFISFNSFALFTDFIANPRAYGFTTSNVACCGQGPYNGVGRCTVASNLCPDRGDYVFWDSVHETQKVVELIVYQIFYGSIDFIAPMNLSTIMAVDHWT
ncbi:GDSL esterase/lipase At5g33370 [Linum perenne]